MLNLVLTRELDAFQIFKPLNTLKQLFVVLLFGASCGQKFLGHTL